MVVFPPAKINLGLHILAKRGDGYHDLETCFYPLGFTDILEVLPAQEFGFVQTGIPIPGDPEDNLCVRAIRLMTEDHSLPPVQAHLHKIIPTGAGLGGGSSDAAYALRALNHLFSVGLGQEQLSRYAIKLGSDCSFFLQDRPQLGTGRGEILHSVNVALQGLSIVLLNPHLHVSTQAAYAGVQPALPANPLEKILENQPPTAWRGLLKNDFEKTVFPAFPPIAQLRDALYEAGALYASMSGSGATVFGLFAQLPPNLKARFGNALLWHGPLDY